MDLPDTILLKIMIRTSGFARAMCTEIRPLAGFARRAENLRMQGREYAYILNAMAEVRCFDRRRNLTQDGRSKGS